MASTNLKEAAANIQAFQDGDLTGRLAFLESAYRGHSKTNSIELAKRYGITPELLQSAFTFKRIAGQINVLIHAVGILASLPYILRDGEKVEYLSLGAGNTGREFDLETDRQIAEFKFINWRGGPESIRQNGLFKDFYRLAEADSPKERFLYLLELDRPLRFLNGRRALLTSVLSKDQALHADFAKRFGNRFSVVCDYYAHRRARVALIDLSTLVPGLRELEIAGGESDG